MLFILQVSILSEQKKFLNMFDTIEDECDICIRYKKAPSRPMVGFTLQRSSMMLLLLI